jgi:3-hydroxyisobutyrate dehydrogenase-like beta-hydroxyacid dehydrogenase
VRLLENDVRLALQAARSMNVSLSATAATESVLVRALELGHGERHLAALHEVLGRLGRTMLVPH